MGVEKTEYYEDGSRYIGEFKDRKYHGQGTRAYEDGSKYVGEWYEGKKNGQGTYTSADGEKYTGGWKDDKKTGEGTYSYEDGSKYSGEWNNDLQEGRGTLIKADGVVLEGYFSAGKYIDKTKISNEDMVEDALEVASKTVKVAGIDNNEREIKEIRIFLSSTFLDLNEERQYLMNNVFPIFIARLRKRAVDLNVIDLRWGVQPEEKIGEKGEKEKVSKNTLEVCLKEAYRCYPLFIGIIGGRYGWIPEVKDVDRETDFYQKYKDKFDKYLSQRKSMTEIEILFGALERDTNPIDYKFYLGDEEKYKDSQENYAIYTNSEQEQLQIYDEAIVKQKALRERLEQSRQKDDKVFVDSVSLGKAVFKDMERLIQDLEKQGLIPANDIPEEELKDLEIRSFEKQKTKGYVDREASKELDLYLAKLTGKSTREQKHPYFLVGPSGTGKSTLIARWSSQLEGNSDIKIIKIYVGIQNDITTQKDLIRHILERINQLFKLDREIPDDEELYNQFEIWLSYITETTLIIIDGINQLSDFYRIMSWIPDTIFQSVGLIITSNTSIQIGRRNHFINEHKMKGFTVEEKQRFIEEYLFQASKNISTEGKKALMEKNDNLGENPLFVSVVLQELIRSGRRDIYTQEEIVKKDFTQDSVLGIINSLSSSLTMEEVFGKLFSRYEKDYGSQLVSQLLSILALSRNGMYYNELVDIVRGNLGASLSGIEFQALFSILEDKLIIVGGKLAFYHDFLKNGVQKKYQADEAKYRKQIARYYKGIIKELDVEIDLHQAEEASWQLERLKDWETLYGVICNKDVLFWMLNYHTDDVSGYFKYFKEIGNDFNTFYENIKESIKFDENLNNLVGNLFYTNGEFELSLRLMENQEASLMEKYGEEDPGLWTAWHNLGTVYRAKGEYDKAIILLEKAGEKRESELGEDALETLFTWTNLATAYYEKEDMVKAIPLFEKVAKKQEAKFGDEYVGLRTTWNNLALCYIDTGELIKAMDLLKKAGAKEEEKYGEDYPGVWTIWSNYAIACHKRGDFDQAIIFFEKVVAKQEDKYGDDNLDLWMNWSNLAESYHEKGDLDKAIGLLEKAVTKMESKYGEDYPDLWTLWINLAFVYKDKGAIDRAIELFKKAAEKKEAKFGSDFTGLWPIWSNLVDAYKVKGDKAKADALIKRLSGKRLMRDGFLTGNINDGINGSLQKFIFEDGSTYAGELKYGIPHGQGTLTFVNGDRYVGEVRAGVIHGRGTYYYANGNIYEGEVSAGEITGQGKLSIANSRVVLVGKFINGEIE